MPPEVSAPAQVPQTPAAPPPTSSDDLLAQINADLASARESEASDADDGVVDESVLDRLFGDEKPEEEAPKAEAKEDATKEEPAKVDPPKETDASTLNKLTAAQAKIQRLEAAEVSHKRRADTAEARIKELETQFKTRTESDIFAEFEARGTNWRDWLSKISNGEITPPDVAAKTARDPEMEAMLAEHKATKEKARKDAEQAQFAEVRKQDVAELAEYLQSEHGSEYPLLRATPNVADELIGNLYQLVNDKSEVVTVLPKLLNHYETKVKDQLTVLLASDATLALVRSNPDLFDKIKKAVSTTAEQTNANPGKTIDGSRAVTPTTLTNAGSSEVPARSTDPKSLNDDDWLKELNRHIREGKA